MNIITLNVEKFINDGNKQEKSSIIHLNNCENVNYFDTLVRYDFIEFILKCYVYYNYIEVSSTLYITEFNIDNYKKYLCYNSEIGFMIPQLILKYPNKLQLIEILKEYLVKDFNIKIIIRDDLLKLALELLMIVYKETKFKLNSGNYLYRYKLISYIFSNIDIYKLYNVEIPRFTIIDEKNTVLYQEIPVDIPTLQKNYYMDGGEQYVYQLSKLDNIIKFNKETITPSTPPTEPIMPSLESSITTTTISPTKSLSPITASTSPVSSSSPNTIIPNINIKKIIKHTIYINPSNNELEPCYELNINKLWIMPSNTNIYVTGSNNQYKNISYCVEPLSTIQNKVKINNSSIQILESTNKFDKYYVANQNNLVREKIENIINKKIKNIYNLIEIEVVPLNMKPEPYITNKFVLYGPEYVYKGYYIGCRYRNMEDIGIHRLNTILETINTNLSNIKLINIKTNNIISYSLYDKILKHLKLFITNNQSKFRVSKSEISNTNVIYDEQYVKSSDNNIIVPDKLFNRKKIDRLTAKLIIDIFIGDIDILNNKISNIGRQIIEFNIVQILLIYYII